VIIKDIKLIKLKDILLELLLEQSSDTKKQEEAQDAFLKYCKPIFPDPDKHNTVKFSDSDDEFLIIDKEENTGVAKSKNKRTGQIINIHYQWNYGKPFYYSIKKTNKRGKVEYEDDEKRHPIWEQHMLGWPEKIYGGYLGGYMYLQDKGQIHDSPRTNWGTWYPNKLVWSQNQGLSSEFIKNEPKNEWDCAYGQVKYFADNEKSEEYPNGIWDEIEAGYRPENGFDPNDCNYKGYKID